MAKLAFVTLSALLACASAEPPSGYSYQAPSSIGHFGGGGGDGSAFSGNSHYHAVPAGYQTSEGQYVDHNLLDKIRHIILKDEIHNQQYQQVSSGGHGVSSHYGPPAPVYGVPNERIVGIELGHVTQGIQVAQYQSTELGQGGYSGGGYPSGGYASGYSGYSGGGDGGFSSGGHGGFSSGGHGGFSSGGHGPSISYSAPSVSYSTIAIPSGSYGVPVPSGSYGSPHH